MNQWSVGVADTSESCKQMSEVSVDLTHFWKSLIANKKTIFSNEAAAVAEHWMLLLELMQNPLTVERDNAASFNGGGNF